MAAAQRAQTSLRAADLVLVDRWLDSWMQAMQIYTRGIDVLGDLFSIRIGLEAGVTIKWVTETFLLNRGLFDALSPTRRRRRDSRALQQSGPQSPTSPLLSCRAL